MLFDLAAPTVLAAALLLDGLVGDPRWLWGRLPHPVVLLGRLVAWADGRWNRGARAARRWAGALLLAAALLLAGAAGALVAWPGGAAGWALETAAVFALLAQRDLHDHTAAVARALRRDGTEGGRLAVAHIVGRDPQALDDRGVCRAAIESLAENFADGVVAPLFWYLVAGLPGLAACKAVNTLDSMIGHRDRRHADFGRAAARLDDLVHWLPARLAGLFAALAAVTLEGARAGRALAAMRRDARRHRSPNAGWPEAAFAGALGLALAGPRRYGGVAVGDAWMGDGRAAATAADIDAALSLYRRACWLAGAAAVALLVLFG